MESASDIEHSCSEGKNVLPLKSEREDKVEQEIDFPNLRFQPFHHFVDLCGCGLSMLRTQISFGFYRQLTKRTKSLDRGWMLLVKNRF